MKLKYQIRKFEKSVKIKQNFSTIFLEIFLIDFCVRACVDIINKISASSTHE